MRWRRGIEIGTVYKARKKNFLRKLKCCTKCLFTSKKKIFQHVKDTRTYVYVSWREKNWTVIKLSKQKKEHKFVLNHYLRTFKKKTKESNEWLIRDNNIINLKKLAGKRETRKSRCKIRISKRLELQLHKYDTSFSLFERISSSFLYRDIGSPTWFETNKKIEKRETKDKDRNREKKNT